MPEENAMIPAELVGSLAKQNDDLFKEVTKSADFIPRLQLMTANSKQCKAGEFPVNHYAFIRDQNLQDLGETVDVLAITWRAKALEIGEQVISIFDMQNDEFKRIQEKSAEQDSGCMYGPEFLVYIPQIKEFATFFCGSKSARRESGSVKALMTKPATLKSKKIEGKRYTWFTSTAVPCSTPFEPPIIDDLKKVVDKFNNPPETQVEAAPEEDTDRER